MNCIHRKILILAMVSCGTYSGVVAQQMFPFRLPDTGQTTTYTTTSGEDADFIINPPSFTLNGDGPVTDNNTGLMWQQTDGGEMTWEQAII